MLTQAELKAQLKYDPETGIFTRLNSKSINNYGLIAGSMHSTGYIHIYVKDKVYKAHRLAWLYVYGNFPTKHLDHINRIRNDNRISNLREVDDAQNSLNKKMYTSNKSGIKGVHWHKATNKWAAVITHKGSKIHLGIFKDINEAKYAIQQARDLYHKGYSGVNEIEPHQD